MYIRGSGWLLLGICPILLSCGTSAPNPPGNHGLNPERLYISTPPTTSHCNTPNARTRPPPPPHPPTHPLGPNPNPNVTTQPPHAAPPSPQLEARVHCHHAARQVFVLDVPQARLPDELCKRLLIRELADAFNEVAVALCVVGNQPMGWVGVGKGGGGGG
jgi:hypothetical protein